MPEIWRKINDDVTLVIWNSTEDLKDLFSNARLSEDESEKVKFFNSEKRKREWLTVRYVLRQLLPDADFSSIQYDEHGKPFLKNGVSISISHSHEYIAVMISAKAAIGVDIETFHPGIDMLSSKFVSDEERSSLAADLFAEQLHVIWGAKEVVYKIHGKRGIVFKKDLFVHPFIYQSAGQVTTSLTKSGQSIDYVINYEMIMSYMLTWCLDKYQAV